MRSPHGPALNAADHRDKAVAARASPKISTRKESSMRLKLALLTTVLAFGFGMPAALAEDAPGAKSDITIAGAAPADEAAPAAQDEEK